jgi:DNA replication and repair protein RecF
LRLRRLTLRDFRNVHGCDVALGPRFTVLWGHNGAGKTNLLEAIYLVSTLRSFRTSDASALVRHGADGAQVEVRVDDPVAGLPSVLKVRLDRRGNGVRRTARADGKLVRAAADFYGRVRAVLFTPEDLGVLRGSPSGRRQFLDRMLFARDRAHITDVQVYDKLVRSRNHVLKRDELGVREQNDLLDTYDTGLADAGARIWTRREALLAELREPFAATFRGIHGHFGPAPTDADARAATATVRYAPRLGEAPAQERAARLAEGLRERRAEDLQRRITTVGPHRDDLEVDLDGKPAGEFASQGQARALVLALKLAELEAARAALGHPPLLLLDDVSSELDPTRSAMLFDTLTAEAGQCVLTTTAREFIPIAGRPDTAVLRVDRGRVEPG